MAAGTPEDEFVVHWSWYMHSFASNAFTLGSSLPLNKLRCRAKSPQHAAIRLGADAEWSMPSASEPVRFCL